MAPPLPRLTPNSLRVTSDAVSGRPRLPATPFPKLLQAVTREVAAGPRRVVEPRTPSQPPGTPIRTTAAVAAETTPRKLVPSSVKKAVDPTPEVT